MTYSAYRFSDRAASDAATGIDSAAALVQFERAGNELLGYVVGLGAVVGVLALIIIGGRMIHANFTGDPWIAARGMAELPWVILGIILLIAAGSLAAVLLQGSRHDTEEDLGNLVERVVQEQAAREQESSCEGGLRDPDTSTYVCPDSDRWTELSHTLPLTGADDVRCTYDGAADCYEYCFVTGFADVHNNFEHSPCTPRGDDRDLMGRSDWVWATYHCANLPSSLLNETAKSCKDAIDDFDEVPRKYQLAAGRGEGAVKRYYICTQYPAWVEANREVGDFPQDYCPD
ncbi:hypothetical protein ABZ249_04910 [Nocardiopsis sp. NPDC006139]|uniref:hypothetical protein n=1 Tax=Nocardiopsis sp. NPDC006139 TaxID=3154578 RepID=UPI0033BBDFFF